MMEVGVRLLIARKTAFANLKFEKSVVAGVNNTKVHVHHVLEDGVPNSDTDIEVATGVATVALPFQWTGYLVFIFIL